MASALRGLLVLFCGCTAALVTSPNHATAEAAAPAQRHNLHLHLSQDELLELFSVERHEEVPEYDLFHVRSVRKRRTAGRHRRSVHVRAFDNQIDLDLQMNHEIDNEICLFNSDTHSGRLTIERVEGDKEMYVGDLYQDVERQAALLVDHSDDDTLQLNGVVQDLVIVPAPAHMRGLFPPTPEDDHLIMMEELGLDLEPPERAGNASAGLRVRRSVPQVTRGLHVIYKLPAELAGAAAAAPPSHHDYALIEPEPESAPDYLSRRKKRRAPPDLYPEVLVIVDYETHKLHKFSGKKMKRYILAFINAIDLRYRTLNYPSIAIKIAGIVLSKSKESTPYLEDNMLDSTKLDAENALESLGKYLYQERRLPMYDMVLTLTKRDMCTRRTRISPCTSSTAGYAYIGGGCSISKYYNKINSVAIVEDTGGFSGIIVATHELGHLMGAVHDGSEPPKYLGGPGARLCPWNDGYIMSDLRRDYRGHQWSECSVKEFAFFASNPRSQCMYNYPKRGRLNKKRRQKLPGQLLSLDAQCKHDTGSIACFQDDRVCAELYCYEPSSGFCVSTRPAAEGSSCGRGMHCINGHCKAKGFHY